MYKKENIFEVANWLYDNRINEWGKFTNGEIVKLWSKCIITMDNPYGEAWDDEVYNEMARRGLLKTAQG